MTQTPQKNLQLLLRILLVFGTLAGCASVDFDYPKVASQAVTDTDDTKLGRLIVPLTATLAPGESFFMPMGDAVDALSIRLLMAQRAERTLDAQYYLWTPDTVGYAFLDALLKAADRGVRVRLLLDDILTGGYDAAMAGLDSHPNFEVRIFNPFARRSLRAIDGVTSFSRINRRMHNKSFTADNQITLIGGRNIAAEYFGAREDSKFGDLDVIAAGPVVHDISDMFDSYWNHRAAAAIPSFAKMPDDPAAALQALRDRIAASRETIIDSPYADAVRKSVDHYLNRGGELFTAAPYELAYDSPDKSDKKLAEEATSITTTLASSIESAQKEIILASPYFVPLKAGVKWLKSIQAKGVQIVVITNSFGANNHKSVHGGYIPYRKELLEAGVKIYEVRPDANVRGAEITSSDNTLSTLHTKAFIVDREEIFIGSFNFDPRSININTELGVIIKSPKISTELAEAVDNGIKANAYEVFLNEDGKVRWRAYDNGGDLILDKEPDTTWWNRFTLGFYRILPIRGQL